LPRAAVAVRPLSRGASLRADSGPAVPSHRMLKPRADHAALRSVCGLRTASRPQEARAPNRPAGAHPHTYLTLTTTVGHAFYPTYAARVDSLFHAVPRRRMVAFLNRLRGYSDFLYEIACKNARHRRYRLDRLRARDGLLVCISLKTSPCIDRELARLSKVY